jgi:hypothetical protein
MASRLLPLTATLQILAVCLFCLLCPSSHLLPRRLKRLTTTSLDARLVPALPTGVYFVVFIDQLMRLQYHHQILAFCVLLRPPLRFLPRRLKRLSTTSLALRLFCYSVHCFLFIDYHLWLTMLTIASPDLRLWPVPLSQSRPRKVENGDAERWMMDVLTHQ